jgi:TonB family protein
MKKELIEKGAISAAEIKELDRRQNLNQNPFRRPTFLKDIIDKNSEELRYIYNKRLRSGLKLSGKMLIEFVIKADGSIGNLRVVHSNIGDQTFESEITDRIYQWRFNVIPDSLGELTINYPFEFFEEQ